MQSAAISIRVADRADAAAIFAVHQASVRNLCRGAYSAEHLAAWFDDRTPEIYFPALAEGRIRVAEQEREIVGFVGAMPGEVTLLFVRPEVAGMGLGSRLFKLGLSIARISFEGEVVVVATVNSEPFYERFGFAAVEQQSFVRGKEQLHYPVVKMLAQSRAGASSATGQRDA